MNDQERTLVVLAVATAVVAVVQSRQERKRELLQENQDDGNKGRVPDTITIKRQRRNLPALFLEIGPTTFRRMYRMNEGSFFALLL
jgi:hypothetical protein